MVLDDHACLGMEAEQDTVASTTMTTTIPLHRIHHEPQDRSRHEVHQAAQAATHGNRAFGPVQRPAQLQLMLRISGLIATTGLSNHHHHHKLDLPTGLEVEEGNSNTLRPSQSRQVGSAEVAEVRASGPVLRAPHQRLVRVVTSLLDLEVQDGVEQSAVLDPM